jgi:hypothetical protein
MAINRLLVEGVYFGGLGGSRAEDDFLGERLDGRQVGPVRKSLAPSRAKARATALPTAPAAP